MSGRGRKRAGRGVNSSTSMQQQQQQGHQVRQGSSFWMCPACGVAVHTALMSFHVSCCPVVGGDDVFLTKTKRLLRQERPNEGRDPVGSPEFSLVSVSERKRGVPQKPAWEEEEEEEEEEEDVTLEGEQLHGRGSPSTEAGSRGEKLFSPEPETPIQEGRDRIALSMAVTASPSPLEGLKRGPAEALRKRLFEDWGQKLSPDRDLVVELSPSDTPAAVPSSPVDDPQAKRPKVVKPDVDDMSRMVVDFGLTYPGSEGDDVADVAETVPYLGSIRDSQQEWQEEEVVAQPASDHREEIPKELGEKLGSQQKLQGDRHCSLETARELQNGEGFGACQSEREVQLESDIKELRAKYSGALLMETELQRALHVKNEECKELRRSEQGLLSELLFVKGRASELATTLQELRELVNRGEQKTTANHVNDMVGQSQPTQIYKEEESLATQLLSQTSHCLASLASCIGSPKAVKDELDITTVSSENLLDVGNEEQATQLLSDGFYLGCSPCIPEAGGNSQASAEIKRIYGSGTGPLEGMQGESSLSPKTTLSTGDRLPVRRLFDGGAETPKGSSKDEFERPLLHLRCAAAALLAPQTPGKTLKPAADEHDKNEGSGGNGNANLHTVGNQRSEGTVGGGPKTPEKLAVMLGGQGKGLISEMLDSFPPAQGIETQCGIDPFDDHFPETVNRATSNVTSIAKDPSEHPMQDVRTFVSVSGADQKFGHDNDRPAVSQPTGDSQEVTLAELGPKKKRPALVSDLDDNKRPAEPQPSEDSEVEILAEMWPDRKRPENPALGSDSDDSERPALPQPSEDSQEEPLAEMGLKRKRQKNLASVIDSDSDVDIADEDILHDVRPTTSTGNLRKGTQGSMLSGTKVGKSDSGVGRQTSNPAVDSRPGPPVKTSPRNRSFDQRRPSNPNNMFIVGLEGEAERPSSPTVNVLFGMEGKEENAPGISGGGSRKTSSSEGSPDPIIEALRRDRRQFRKVISPRSANAVLSSSVEEDDIGEGSRRSGKEGKRRRLVRVQESPDGTDSPDPVLEGSKETGPKEVRRSERLRNVYTSVPKRSTDLSGQEEESDSIQDMRCEDLGTSGDGSSSKPLVLDDDEEDRIEIDSNSSDDRPIAARLKHKNDKATQSRKSSTVQGDLFGNKLDFDVDVDVDVEDDIDTDDSFINDDPESDVEAHSSSAIDDISDSGEESEKDGSLGSKCSSGKGKRYKWELEGDMLADLGKDSDLCLRGLCALYRRQEEDEKLWSSSKYKNKMGLSAFHAARASNYASFLMEGFMSGPVSKTAKELEEEFDEDAVTYCSNMSSHYSKQLFDIYQNHEDPFFPEPYTDPLM